MKHALINGQLTPATTDAPVTASCPHCGGLVKLRNRQGTYFWQHVQLPLGGCHPLLPELAVMAEADLLTQGKSAVRWFRMSGSVQGRLGNWPSYRDGALCLQLG